MSEEPEKQPFSESNLDSAEYRERLKRKLNCLIAVLEVATAKVRKSLAGPAPDVERLKRIQSNLQNTLAVCERARTALERREALPKDLPENLAAVMGRASATDGVVVPPTRSLPLGAAAEMTSEAERRKFERMGRIDPAELRAVDLEALTRLLQA